jgi:photosystem II stability/assembly factor-like uncharacterized protein
MYAPDIPPPLPRLPSVVHAGVIARPPHTLAPGSALPGTAISGARIFTDGRHGVALAGRGGAEYAAATADGGRTWHTDSPALHLDAAQAPLAVSAIGTAGRRVAFAYGAGNVVDVTSDGGRTWRRALWSDGVPAAVVPAAGGGLAAFVNFFPHGPTRQYISRDGGRTWRFAPPPAG